MRRTSLVLLFVAGTPLSALAGGTMPNGVASGDTTQTSSVLWGRSTALGAITFEYSTDPAFGTIDGMLNAMVTDAQKPAKVSAAGLTPGTKYYYRATDAAGTVSNGTFRTSHSTGFNGFRFGASGDWRGELAPYVGAKNAVGRDLEMFAALGDTIYADFPSPGLPLPQAQTLNEFRAKHAEVYGERYGLNVLADLRASTSIIATIDDHEVTNDFEGFETVANDPRFAFGGAAPTDRLNRTPLFNNGLQAFQEYNPMNEETWSNTGSDPRMDGVVKLYRERSYGKDAAVFNLDNRSFRDPALAGANPLDPVSVGNFLVNSFNPTRTFLGDRQVDTLKADLLAAQSNGTTWKFVMNPEPIQNLGVVGASDRWEGYAAERTELLKFIDDNNIENVVFVSADIHGTLVNNVTYQNGPGQPQISTGAFEVTTGSLAFDAPFGPTVAELAFGLGIPGALNPAVYASLSIAQQEAYVQSLVNAQITPLGYDPIGLQGSDINATLLQGSYTATNTYGWTEFDVDPITQVLTVTTYGVPFYTEADLLADPSLILSLEPQIVSQFQVTPVPGPGVLSLFGVAGLAMGRRRRN